MATFHTFNLAKFWYTKLIVADTYALVYHKNIPLFKKVAKTNQSRIGLLFLIVVLVFILVLRRLAAEEGT